MRSRRPDRRDSPDRRYRRRHSDHRANLDRRDSPDRSYRPKRSPDRRFEASSDQKLTHSPEKKKDKKEEQESEGNDVGKGEDNKEVCNKRKERCIKWLMTQLLLQVTDEMIERVAQKITPQEKNFHAAKKFLGKRKGFVFKVGDVGLGYYKDDGGKEATREMQRSLKQQKLKHSKSAESIVKKTMSRVNQIHRTLSEEDLL